VDAADIAWDAWRRDDGTWVVIATFPLPPNTHVATWTYDSGSRTMTVVDDNAGALSAIDPQAPLRLAASRPMLATVASIEDEEDDEEPAVVTSLPAWGHDRAAFDEPSEPAGRDEAESRADSPSEEPGLEAVGPWDDSDDSEDLEDSEDLGAAADEREFEDPSVEEIEDSFDEAADVDESEPTDAVPEVDGDEAAQPTDSGPTADAEDVPLFQTPAPPAQRPTGKPSVPSFDDILFGPGPGK
jgi:hypothetical protein